MSKNKNPVINKRVVQSMIALLDWIYRMGLTDSVKADDEGLLRSFCDKVAQAGVYGFVTDEYTITWQEWVLRLLSKVRTTTWNGIMTKYFDRARYFGANYLSVFFNIAQCYYVMGIQDYLAAGGVVDLGLLESKKRVRLTEKGKFRNIKMQEYVDTVQQLSFSLQRRDAVILDNAQTKKMRGVALNAGHYNMFRRAIGLAVMEI